MRISEFAQRLGVSTDTVRRWEAQGLIEASRDWANHRRFTPENLERGRQLLHRRTSVGRSNGDRGSR